MVFSILMLAAVILIACRIATRERAVYTHIYSAGQFGLLAAVPLFGVNDFTSFFYADEMTSSLHLCGLQRYGYIALAVLNRRYPVRLEPKPIPADDYDPAFHIDHPEAPSLLASIMNPSQDRKWLRLRRKPLQKRKSSR